MLKNIFFGLLIILCLIAGGWLLAIGADKDARYQCETWTRQATQFSGFYLLEWQKQQCDSVGAPVNAVTVAFCDDNESATACQKRLGDKWEVIHYPQTNEMRGELK